MYATYLTAPGRDEATAIAVDSAGSAYVTGFTDSPDFPTTAGAFQRTLKSKRAPNVTAFVTKFNPAGNALVYSTFVGGTGYSFASAIVLDKAGDAYFTGTADTDFPVTPGVVQTSNGGARAIFIAGLNPSGTALLAATYLGGSGEGFDVGYGIALDPTGTVLGITGQIGPAYFHPPATTPPAAPTLACCNPDRSRRWWLISFSVNAAYLAITSQGGVLGAGPRRAIAAPTRRRS